MVRKMMRRKGIVAIAMSVALLCAGLVPGIALAYDPSDPNDLDLNGSTTVAPIAEASMPQFIEDYPGTTMQVHRTGSGDGIGFLMASPPETDIGMASREWKTGDGDYNLVDQTVLARDGIAVIVREGVTDMGPVLADGMTKEQIKWIYERGSAITTTNWNDIPDEGHPETDVSDDWPAQPVLPRARETDSGTRSAFGDICGIDNDTLEKATITATGAARAPGNSDMCEMVGGITTDWPDLGDYQIGYCGLGYLTNPTYSSLIEAVPMWNGSEFVLPSLTTVGSGDYPVARQLNMFTLKTPPEPKPLIQDYLDWIVGPKGQAIVLDEGFVNIDVAAPDWDPNVDNQASIGDVVYIGLKWGLTGDPNWIRQDANNDGQISIGDVVFVGLHWGETW